ncbi:hypothetical protein K438DRAFT_1778109 [Mycena galopus ATCC 62051]|nr:hypothetical protein K438DRAFT_1778109 [Mycena galopus ATCC 62051]
MTARVWHEAGGGAVFWCLLMQYQGVRKLGGQRHSSAVKGSMNDKGKVRNPGQIETSAREKNSSPQASSEPVLSRRVRAGDVASTMWKHTVLAFPGSKTVSKVVSARFELKRSGGKRARARKPFCLVRDVPVKVLATFFAHCVDASATTINALRIAEMKVFMLNRRGESSEIRRIHYNIYGIGRSPMELNESNITPGIGDTTSAPFAREGSKITHADLQYWRSVTGGIQLRRGVQLNSDRSNVHIDPHHRQLNEAALHWRRRSAWAYKTSLRKQASWRSNAFSAFAGNGLLNLDKTAKDARQLDPSGLGPTPDTIGQAMVVQTDFPGIGNCMDDIQHEGGSHSTCQTLSLIYNSGNQRSSGRTSAKGNMQHWDGDSDPLMTGPRTALVPISRPRTTDNWKAGSPHGGGGREHFWLRELEKVRSERLSSLVFSSCSKSESRPLEFPSSPTPMTPPSDDEFPDSLTVPGRNTRSTKRKSDVASDTSDADIVPPPKKKPKAKKKSPHEQRQQAQPLVFLRP